MNAATPVARPQQRGPIGADHDPAVPRRALVAAGAVVAFSIALASMVSLGVLPRESVPAVARAEAHVSVLGQRSLRFVDQRDGAVRIEDTATGSPVLVLRDGVPGNGFVRGVLRGFARDRRARGIGSEAPFQLTAWSDRGLTLADSATGRSVELGGFGPDNRAVFAALVAPQAASAAGSTHP